MHTLKFRLAVHKDIPDLLHLINSAYRSHTDKSWTSEALIVSGDRINQAQLKGLIEAQHAQNMQSQFLVAELNVHADRDIIGCIALNYVQRDVEIGTFCILAEFQNLGYGQQVLQAAELYALKYQPKLKTLTMWVLDVRSELIEYYERRGYLKTGQTDVYPIDAQVGQPMLKLGLIQMQKII